MNHWICIDCEQEVYAIDRPNISWTDGHTCDMVMEDE